MSSFRSILLEKLVSLTPLSLLRYILISALLHVYYELYTQLRSILGHEHWTLLSPNLPSKLKKKITTITANELIYQKWNPWRAVKQLATLPPHICFPFLPLLNSSNFFFDRKWHQEKGNRNGRKTKQRVII